MKKITLCCGLLLVSSLLSVAQSAPGGERRPYRLSPEKRAEKLSKIQERTLHLSGRQAQKIKLINRTMATQINKIRTEPGLDNNTREEKIKALKEERNNRYKEVFSASQFKKWNDWEMKKKALRQDNRDQHKADKLAEKTAKSNNT